jgi:hypothetical protein
MMRCEVQKALLNDSSRKVGNKTFVLRRILKNFIKMDLSLFVAQEEALTHFSIFPFISSFQHA